MQQIVIPRKDAKGTIRIQYATEPWKVGVHVDFLGQRGARHLSQWLSPEGTREFAEQLRSLSSVPTEDQQRVVSFCCRIYFNMKDRFAIWISNAEEISAVLLMVADIYDQKGVKCNPSKA